MRAGTRGGGERGGDRDDAGKKTTVHDRFSRALIMLRTASKKRPQQRLSQSRADGFIRFSSNDVRVKNVRVVSPRSSVFVVLLLLALLAPVARATAATLDAPDGLAFYNPPASLPSQVPGTLVWARAFSGGSALTQAATNTLLLYVTTSPTGKAVAVSGTLSIPHGTPPAGGWPIVSWAHGTTGDAPQCAPSRWDHMNSEQRMLNDWVRNGYAVIQTDYEGEATPGVHPYFIGVASARDVADIVRAARQFDATLGTKWAVMGHSEGGAATLWTAALAQTWAPELNLVGAVSYAPGSHLTMLLHAETMTPLTGSGLVYFGYMVEAAAAVNPAVDLPNLLSDTGTKLMPQLFERCTLALLDDPQWNTVLGYTLFKPDADFSALKAEFAKNEPGSLSYSTPTLLVQGTADQTVDAIMSDDLAKRLCKNGVPLTYREYDGADHQSVMTQSLGDVYAWVRQRFAGDAVKSTCGASSTAR
jgi:alpha-beta hydrolase superfamily lysophospholipase